MRRVRERAVTALARDDEIFFYADSCEAVPFLYRAGRCFVAERLLQDARGAEVATLYADLHGE